MVIRKITFTIITFLCIFMFGNILFFPATWKLGWNKAHDAIIQKIIDSNKMATVSSATVTKYSGHILVQFTHILPGSIWATILPLQLHPAIRKSYPHVHHILGYIFTVAGIIMMFGVAMIDRRNLYWFENDYPEIMDPLMWRLFLRYLNRCLLVWFVFTVLMAVYQARRKKLIAHESWIMRHAGSGIWVALQRIFTMLLYRKGNGLMEMKRNFEFAYILSIVLCMGTAEVLIWHKNSKTKYEKVKRF